MMRLLLLRVLRAMMSPELTSESKIQTYIVDFPTELLDQDRQLKLRQALATYHVFKNPEAALDENVAGPSMEELSKAVNKSLYKALRLIESRGGDDSVADLWIKLFTETVEKGEDGDG